MVPLEREKATLFAHIMEWPCYAVFHVEPRWTPTVTADASMVLAVHSPGSGCPRTDPLSAGCTSFSFGHFNTSLWGTLSRSMKIRCSCRWPSLYFSISYRNAKTHTYIVPWWYKPLTTLLIVWLWLLPYNTWKCSDTELYFPILGFIGRPGVFCRSDGSTVHLRREAWVLVCFGQEGKFLLYMVIFTVKGVNWRTLTPKFQHDLSQTFPPESCT